MSPWRNRLVRSAVNRKDVGLSPSGDANFKVLFIYLGTRRGFVNSVDKHRDR